MSDSVIPAPFVSNKMSVPAEWIDVNGHMNVARYLQAFDQAFDEVYEQVGLTAEHMRVARGTTFAAEMHITYQRELLLGDPVSITTRLLGFDVKRMHWIQCMYHREQGYLAATNEWLILYVDIDKRRTGRMPAALERGFQAVLGRPRPASSAARGRPENRFHARRTAELGAPAGRPTARPTVTSPAHQITRFHYNRHSGESRNPGVTRTVFSSLLQALAMEAAKNTA